MVKFLGKAEKQDIPELRTAGTPNPELVPIIKELLATVDTEDFFKIECEDKKELERTRESLRNQLRQRGYAAKATSKTVNKQVRDKKTGATKSKVKLYLYMAAFSKPGGKEQANGKSGSEPNEA